MPLDCSRITVGFTMDSCDDMAVAGVASRVILISKSDIDYGRSVVTNNIISEIILKQGTQGYEVDTLPNTTVGEDTINVGTYTRTHQHSVTVRIFKKSEAAKAFVNGTTRASVVAILENNNRGDDGEVKYEVYGWNSGLVLNELTATTDLTDDAAYVLSLGSGTTARENSLPKSFYNTDEATTDAAVNALLTVAPAP